MAWVVPEVVQPDPGETGPGDQPGEGLAEEVGVDGSAVGSAEHQAAGFSRVTSPVRHPLNRALHGVLDLEMAEFRSPETRWPQRVYRLHGHSPISIRELGPRELYEVPLDEVAAVLSWIAARHPGDDNKALNRRFLDLHGLTRLTGKADRYLDAAHALRSGPEEPVRTRPASPPELTVPVTPSTESARPSPPPVRLAPSGTSLAASLEELVYRVAVLERDDPSGPSAPMPLLTASDAEHWAAILLRAHRVGHHFCLLAQSTETACDEVEIGLLERCLEVPASQRTFGLMVHDRPACLADLRRRHQGLGEHRGCAWAWWKEHSRPLPVQIRWWQPVAD